MIEFVSVSQASITQSDMLILAETTYDENILGSTAPWIVLPYLAKPYESQADWDVSNDHSESEYISSISNSAAANAALTAIVNLSNQGKHIFIGCYDYNVKRSHLSTLFDIMEDLFLEEAPELHMMGG